MSEVKVDTISERTAAGGVTIDGVLLKDSIVNTDNIAEKTAAAGVTIDGVLVKDGVATFQTPAGSPLVFEGATANAFETTFAITDPTADRTITFPDADITLGASGDLTPAWQMSMSVTQASMTSGTWYDINFDTVDIDTDSGCDTTAKTYTIPAGKGGKYMVGVRVFTGNNSGGYGYTLLNESEIKLRKNPAGADTLLMDVWMDWRNNPVRRGPLVGCIMLDLTAGDILYVEVRNHITTGGNYGVVVNETGGNVFYGFKLLGV
jgi:hypothetical protein